MKILIFSDIHGDLAALKRVVAQPADIYIAAGDLSNFSKGLERCGEEMIELGERAWILPGNHETHKEMAQFCKRFGFTDFHRQTRKLNGTNWAGLGYSNITPFKTPGNIPKAKSPRLSRHSRGWRNSISSSISRRATQNSTSTRKASTPEVPLCAPGWKRKNLFIFSAGTFMRPRA
jgi:3',5'-cyclic AMP phosphodiesterase CpdA